MSVPITAQATFAATLVDEWIRAGVTDAVICPGSRSTPLAVALADRDELSIHVRLDERSAGFFALGLALDQGVPTVVCVTSGTAAAELHPAVIESDLSRLPLIVCTADRPPELHEVGAPQTINQTHLYGSSVRWFFEPGVADHHSEPTWRSLAARAAAEAKHGPAGPGPVHLNLAFRDPLMGQPGPLPLGRPDGTPLHRVVASNDLHGDVLARSFEAWAGRPGLIVAGAGARHPHDVIALSTQMGWPVLADPRSGCRLTSKAVVGAADSFLRHEELANSLLPEIVLVLGAPWVSKVVNAFLADASGQGCEVIAVDPWWRWVDPDRIATTIYRTDVSQWLQAAVVHGTTSQPHDDWWNQWHRAESLAQEAIDETLQAEEVMTEPAVAREILSVLPDGTHLVVSSSMPVRDLEWFTPLLQDPAPVHANRGANGIDGVVSTALGLSAASSHLPVVAVVGDLAFLHDSSALVGSLPAPSSCTVVVLDNRGGGIFSFLPQAGSLDHERYELLFGTPQGADVAAVAAGFGHRVDEVDDMVGLRARLSLPPQPGISVVVVRLPDRAANVAVHDRINANICAAIDGAKLV